MNIDAQLAHGTTLTQLCSGSFLKKSLRDSSFTQKAAITTVKTANDAPRTEAELAGVTSSNTSSGTPSSSSRLKMPARHEILPERLVWHVPLHLEQLVRLPAMHVHTPQAASSTVTDPSQRPLQLFGSGNTCAQARLVQAGAPPLELQRQVLQPSKKLVVPFGSVAQVRHLPAGAEQRDGSTHSFLSQTWC
jgi:hypothetical protein